MINLHNLDRWEELTEEGVRLVKEDTRVIKLEINCIDAELYIREEGKEEPRFLAYVTGRETVRFAVAGSVEIYTGAEHVYFHTSEVHAIPSYDGSAKKSFVELVTRRERNPELERYMHLANQNMENRLEKMNAAFEKRLQRLAGDTPPSTRRAAAKKLEQDIGKADDNPSNGTGESGQSGESADDNPAEKAGK